MDVCAGYKPKILPETYAADLVLYLPGVLEEPRSQISAKYMSHCVTPLTFTYVSAGEALGRARSNTPTADETGEELGVISLFIRLLPHAECVLS